MEHDTDCEELQDSLNKEVGINIDKIQLYLKIWEPFRDMWEVDKERFTIRYQNQKPSAAAFDANIGRYTEVANNVQVQETISVVHFIMINAGDLKKSIIDHCILWQQMLCNLLLRMTTKRIEDVYEYIRANSEK